MTSRHVVEQDHTLETGPYAWQPCGETPAGSFLWERHRHIGKRYRGSPLPRQSTACDRLAATVDLRRAGGCSPAAGVTDVAALRLTAPYGTLPGLRRKRGISLKRLAPPTPNPELHRI